MLAFEVKYIGRSERREGAWCEKERKVRENPLCMHGAATGRKRGYEKEKW